MPCRKIRLADPRGREATVLLVPRQKTSDVSYTDSSGSPVRFTRRIKATETTNYSALLSQYDDPDSLAQALIDGDPEIDVQTVGRDAGPCDRVYVGENGQPLFSTRIIEVIHDRNGNEIARHEPENIPSNLVPDAPPQWSGKLIPQMDAIRQYAFTRVYQIRHSNGLEFDFLFGLARYLEECNSMALVGSGPKGTGPLILERNGIPMKGFLEGRTKGDRYRLVLHLAAFELKRPEMSS